MCLSPLKLNFKQTLWKFFENDARLRNCLIEAKQIHPFFFIMQINHMLALISFFFSTDVPDPPEILRIDEGLNNLKIHWKESITKPKFSILSYMVQIKEKGESHEWINCAQIENQTGSMMCLMDELKSNTEYIVRVSARNVVGFSEFTMREVSTKEPTGNGFPFMCWCL